MDCKRPFSNKGAKMLHCIPRSSFLPGAKQVMEKNSWSPEVLFTELGGGKDW